MISVTTPGIMGGSNFSSASLKATIYPKVCCLIPMILPHFMTIWEYGQHLLMLENRKLVL